ncbi:hypothetical protein AVEN_72580-1 [Araneus ventricosus]|uniref:Uncharacterized protein n=1 Tax=Araneus ventricosus TaxID=182803 RepID=A0A4Y2N684_ARAVE|nr:hypothetical protein AVEN_72580-1 [Araneus ventricosus]
MSMKPFFPSCSISDATSDFGATGSCPSCPGLGSPLYNNTVCNDKSTFSDIFLAPNMVPNFFKIAQAAEIAKRVDWPICYMHFGDFAPPYPKGLC